MTAKGYACFGAMAAALGLWGFYLGRSSAEPQKPPVVAIAAPPVMPAPAAVEPTPVPEPEPVAASAKKAVKVAAPKPRPAAPEPAPAPSAAPAPPALEPAPAANPVISPPAPPEPPKPAEAAKVFTPEKEYESAAPPKPREPHTATIPAGTLLTVRLKEGLSTERNSAGDTFAASLDQPLVIDGFVLAERGASVRGHITELVQPGRVKGRSALALELKSLSTSDGQRLDLETDSFRREGENTVKKDAARAGVLTAIGAAVGAIAGGGKGAAIGAGVGGAAGAGAVLATRGEDAKLPAETRITFRLKNPVTVTEKLD